MPPRSRSPPNSQVCLCRSPLYHWPSIDGGADCVATAVGKVISTLPEATSRIRENGNTVLAKPPRKRFVEIEKMALRKRLVEMSRTVPARLRTQGMDDWPETA